MAKRDQDVHFLASKEEVERIHEKMDELGIRSMGAYLRKMALDGYCIRLDLQDVKALVSLLRICSNNLNQYAKRANETGSIYRADIEDLQKRLEEIWTDMREVLVRLSSIQRRSKPLMNCRLQSSRPCNHCMRSFISWQSRKSRTTLSTVRSEKRKKNC